MKAERITSFKAFYPHYLSEHRNKTSRRLHFVGTLLVFITLFYGIAMSQYHLLWLCLPLGYGFAWVGHFFFEKNKPATFRYPLWSLASDFKLFFEILTGKQPF